MGFSTITDDSGCPSGRVENFSTYIINSTYNGVSVNYGKSFLKTSSSECHVVFGSLETSNYRKALIDYQSLIASKMLEFPRKHYTLYPPYGR